MPPEADVQIGRPHRFACYTHSKPSLRVPSDSGLRIRKKLLATIQELTTFQRNI